MLADRGVDVALTSKTSRAAIEATVAEAERRGVRLNNPGNQTGGILSHLNGILGILRHA